MNNDEQIATYMHPYVRCPYMQRLCIVVFKSYCCRCSRTVCYRKSIALGVLMVSCIFLLFGSVPFRFWGCRFSIRSGRLLLPFFLNIISLFIVFRFVNTLAIVTCSECSRRLWIWILYQRQCISHTFPFYLH